ncbi:MULTISPECIES: hypothetical protein [Mycobacteriales]|uniref:Phage protein n=2 Tax=Mycobacteriales TaxID=85007 RepID=A0AB38RMS8_RHOSG|nr:MULTISPECIES: hypothetical protein [Rhodococcus]MYV31795.1 hypothetical protein [Rhodococcus erythropolis]REK81737.1 hypothetical protein DVG80_20900 [Rhodococcus erythropolis]UPU46414.1 hypothetical protein M0639_30690 [Rhodococcus qingshengii JCM 15477]
MSIPVYQPGPADWRHLDREAAAELWLELGQWVEWLRRRYNVGGQQIRSCWYKHDPMVEELTAAMWAHREVYQQLKKNPYHGGMAAWHNHVLWPMISRLPKMGFNEECRGGECGYQPNDPKIGTDFAEFVAADTDPRPEAADAPLIDQVLGLVDSAAGKVTALTMDQVLEMIDGGRATAEDPSDDFTAVEIDGDRWEFDDDTETYRPVE